MAIVAGSERILVASVTASAASTIDFTTGIDSTYDEYELHYIGIRVSVDSVNFYGDLSDDGLVTVATNPNGSRAVLSHTATEGALFQVSTVFGGLDGTPSTNAIYRPGNAAGESISGIIRIYAPTDTSIITTWSAVHVFTTAGGNMKLLSFCGACNPTAGEIDSVRLYPTSGTVTGEARLYGISKTV